MFKVNNKTLGWQQWHRSGMSFCWLWIYLRPFLSVDIVNLEQVSAGWETNVNLKTFLFNLFDICLVWYPSSTKSWKKLQQKHNRENGRFSKGSQKFWTHIYRLWNLFKNFLNLFSSNFIWILKADSLL